MNGHFGIAYPTSSSFKDSNTFVFHEYSLLSQSLGKIRRSGIEEKENNETAPYYFIVLSSSIRVSVSRTCNIEYIIRKTRKISRYPKP